MEWRHVPGAVFVLVDGDRVVLAEGYGFANLEQRTPVVADRTLLRVGSVSKLVTATALMQLAERGLLDLHADVNRYLKRFQLAPTFAAPVTAANLMTHHCRLRRANARGGGAQRGRRPAARRLPRGTHAVPG